MEDQNKPVDLSETINHGEAIAVVVNAKKKAKNAPTPVYCCNNCGSLFSDKEAKNVVHKDTQEAHKDCQHEAQHLVLIDAGSIRLNDDGNVIGAVRL
jgi:hypothetical protein